MQLRHLSLENFRNFLQLDLAFGPGHTVFHGRNAQGKSNLLEAVYMFAAGKSVRAARERDLIHWDAWRQDIPFARLRGAFDNGGETRRLEVFLQPEPRQDPHGETEGGHLQKLARVNGVPRRASDFVGEVQAVLFEPQDTELAYGPPSVRRRHLDLVLSQVDRSLLRQLLRYQRVLAQRNHLLKAIREGKGAPRELAFWDEELIDSGARIVETRRCALEELQLGGRAVHRELTGGAEELEVAYLPSFPVADAAGLSGLAAAFRQAVEGARAKEAIQAATLVGPHRDDFVFRVNGADLAAFGSRGQHRLATLSLKLAEATYMTSRARSTPILLLDDIFSELDPQRRAFLLERVQGYSQALITTADLGSLDKAFLSGVGLVEVVQGTVRPGGNPPGSPSEAVNESPLPSAGEGSG